MAKRGDEPLRLEAHRHSVSIAGGPKPPWWRRVWQRFQRYIRTEHGRFVVGAWIGIAALLLSLITFL